MNDIPSTSKGITNAQPTSTITINQFLSLCKKKLPSNEVDEEKKCGRLLKLIERNSSSKLWDSKKFGQLVTYFYNCINKENDPVRLSIYYNDFINEFNIAFEGSVSNLKNRKEILRLKGLIKKQMKILAKIIKKISKLDCEELSLDDLGKEDSSYIKKEKYEKRAARCANVLLNLQGGVGKSGRQIEKKFKYNGTEYPEINEAVSLKIKQIMNSKFKSRFGVRPIYSTPQLEDIVEVVNQVIMEKNLHIFEKDQLCTKIEKDIIREIHSRREIELEESWNEYLDDEPLKPETFPDLDDPILNKILNESSENLKERLSSLFEEYQKKFEETNQNNDTILKSQNEEEDENDEDENDEDDDEDDDNYDEEENDEEIEDDNDEDDEDFNDEKLKKKTFNNDEQKKESKDKDKEKQENKESEDLGGKVNKSSDSECEVIEVNKIRSSASNSLLLNIEKNGKPEPTFIQNQKSVKRNENFEDVEESNKKLKKDSTNIDEDIICLD